MDEFIRLQTKIEKWAADRGIFDQATPTDQALKTLEEAGELIAATAGDHRDEIGDAIGDIMVTLIIQASMQRMDVLECLQDAYEIIRKRTGRMQGGKFIKDYNPGLDQALNEGDGVYRP